MGCIFPGVGGRILAQGGGDRMANHISKESRCVPCKETFFGDLFSDGVSIIR